MKHQQIMGTLLCAGILAMGMTACQKEGPFESAGHSIDKAGRTIKNGGKETTGDKIHDAAEDAKDSAKDLTK